MGIYIYYVGIDQTGTYVHSQWSIIAVGGSRVGCGHGYPRVPVCPRTSAGTREIVTRYFDMMNFSAAREINKNYIFSVCKSFCLASLEGKAFILASIFVQI